MQKSQVSDQTLSNRKKKISSVASNTSVITFKSLEDQLQNARTPNRSQTIIDYLDTIQKMRHDGDICASKSWYKITKKGRKEVKGVQCIDGNINKTNAYGVFVLRLIELLQLDEKTRQNMSVIVFFSIEVVPVLYAMGFKKIVVTTGTEFDSHIDSIIDDFPNCEYYSPDKLEELEKKDMRFDVAIGNPPYQKEGQKNFYEIFLEKAKKVAKINAFVIPATYFNEPTNMQHIAYKGYLGSNYFGNNVQISVCWFISDPNKTVTVQYDLHGRSISETVPKGTVWSDIADYEIFQKIAVSDGMTVLSGRLYHSDMIESDSKNGIIYIKSGGFKDKEPEQYWICRSQQHLLAGYGQHKVIFTGMSKSGVIGNMKYVGPDAGIGASPFCIIVKNEKEAKNLIDFFNLPTMLAFVRAAKGDVPNNTSTLFSKIPNMDFSKSWSDADVRKKFKID